MTKATLAASVAEKFPKDVQSKAAAERIVNFIFDSIVEATAAGEDVAFAGFGSFKTSQRSEKEGRNPKTGEKLRIAAKKIPAFKAASKFKQAVDK